MGTWGVFPLRTSGHSLLAGGGQGFSCLLQLAAHNCPYLLLTTGLPAIHATGFLCRSLCPSKWYSGKRLGERSQAGSLAQGVTLEDTHPCPTMGKIQLDPILVVSSSIPGSSCHSLSLYHPWAGITHQSVHFLNSKSRC